MYRYRRYRKSLRGDYAQGSYLSDAGRDVTYVVSPTAIDLFQSMKVYQFNTYIFYMEYGTSCFFGYSAYKYLYNTLNKQGNYLFRPGGNTYGNALSGSDRAIILEKDSVECKEFIVKWFINNFFKRGMLDQAIDSRFKRYKGEDLVLITLKEIRDKCTEIDTSLSLAPVINELAEQKKEIIGLLAKMCTVAPWNPDINKFVGDLKDLKVGKYMPGARSCQTGKVVAPEMKKTGKDKLDEVAFALNADCEEDNEETERSESEDNSNFNSKREAIVKNTFNILPMPQINTSGLQPLSYE